MEIVNEVGGCERGRVCCLRGSLKKVRWVVEGVRNVN